MSYVNVSTILPEHIVALIQDYIDGEYIYIPKKENNKKSWGENTNTRHILDERNEKIYDKYMDGYSTKILAEEFYLSEKSIQRIVLNKKRQK